MTNIPNRSRPFHFAVFPASAIVSAVAAAILLCLSAPAPVHAQKAFPFKATKSTTDKTDSAKPKADDADDALEKAVGKKDAELFSGVMHQFSDGKTLLRVITETTTRVEQEGIKATITGKTTVQGNYGGSFTSRHELIVQQGEQQVAAIKTQFVCDGKTLWTYKPDSNEYMEQPVASMKKSLRGEIMSASMDIVALIGFPSDDDSGKPSSFDLDSAHVTTSLYKGFPCRVLTVRVSDKDKSKTNLGDAGTIKVYLGVNKRLRAIQLEQRADVPMTISETVKVMEPLLPAPSKALFTFTPPAGAVKVEKFSDGGD